MTERLYYADVYCEEFLATVTDCKEGKHGYEITLNRSAFYPEGGGQPGDRGVLITMEQDLIVISDTHEKYGEVVHYADRPLEPGTAVAGRIDWAYRFSLMQNHSGEHIVSGLVHEKFGFENIGFHMSADRMTVDFSGEFSVEDMKLLELRAKEIVWKNVPVNIRLYSEEEVKELQYRSKKELHGQVRIVTFPGADVCACCGTHVSHSGEIGLIKLISLHKFRGGVRMEMVCGEKALEYVNEICTQNQQISVMLSAKPGETADAVSHLKETEEKTRFRMNQMEQEVFAQKAETLKNASISALFAMTLPCAKNGFPPPRPCSVWFISLTNSRKSPSCSPIPYLYPCSSSPEKTAQRPLQTSITATASLRTLSGDKPSSNSSTSPAFFRV